MGGWDTLYFSLQPDGLVPVGMQMIPIRQLGNGVMTRFLRKIWDLHFHQILSLNLQSK
jgi:hypothetical protein